MGYILPTTVHSEFFFSAYRGCWTCAVTGGCDDRASLAGALQSSSELTSESELNSEFGCRPLGRTLLARCSVRRTLVPLVPALPSFSPSCLRSPVPLPPLLSLRSFPSRSRTFHSPPFPSFLLSLLSLSFAVFWLKFL